MKGIKLNVFNEKLSTATKMDIPILKAGEVLIKMIYSPLNPADIALSKGVYGVKPQLPCILGLEGVGKIVECSKEIDQNLLGEIVSVYTHSQPGTFAEYKAAGLRNCMRHGKGEIKDEMMKQYACGMINPLTSYAHLDIVQKRKQKVFVQSLAASQVGRMNIKLAQKLGIEIINIIGKNDKPLIPELKSIGAGTVLFNEDQDFYDTIKQIVKEKDPKVFFDGIGGNFLEKMAALMPNGSEFWSFGVMSRGFKIQIDINQLLFENKKYRGFWANKWISYQDEKEFEKAKCETKKNIDQGIYSTKLSKVFKIEEIGSALTYYLKHMQEGKVLLRP